jgi:VWFA-related protein
VKASRYALSAGLVAVCLTLHGGAQQNPPQQPQATFRAGVNAVRVDVIVTDRAGTPVDDLTAADFDLAEDGKPQQIDSCRLIRVKTELEPGGEAPRQIHTFDDEATELARDDVRIIVIFLDDYHVSRMSALRLHEWFHRFIETQIGLYDLVALMYPLTPTSGLTFTRDKFALTSVIDHFEGRRGDYMPRNDAESQYAMEAPWKVEQIRNEVVVSALKSLSYHLGSLNEGRKSVIVVAENVGLDTLGAGDLIEAANRNNVSFYPLDPQGLGAAPLGASETLRAVAENTNGRAIGTRNNLEAGLESVLRDSSAYYLLGYTSARGADGKFHAITVHTRKPGLDVRARKGYWAPTAAEAARAAEPEKPAAPPAVTGSLAALAEPRGRTVRRWIGMSRGDHGTTRVTFVWEPLPPDPGSGPGDRPARIVLVASSPAGATFFNGPVGNAPPSEAGAPGGGASAPPAGPSRAVFDAPPGTLRMNMTIESSSSSREVLERDARDITVPDFALPRVMLSTPAVFCARTAREFRALRADPVTAVPAATRQFSRTDRLLIRVDTYAPGAAVVAVTANLLNQHGDAMSALTTEASEPSPAGHVIDLPLATLPRGDYVIEIRAKGEAGEARELVAIRVVG